ncbi:hypothetical protein AOLI_G00096980 [Acnodon oligacanthus]
MTRALALFAGEELPVAVSELQESSSQWALARQAREAVELIGEATPPTRLLRDDATALLSSCSSRKTNA